MCRSIKTLHRATEAPTSEEIQAAALQFVRKVSGYRSPSRANEATFNTAVAEVAAASERLLDGLVARPRPTTNGGPVQGSSLAASSTSAVRRRSSARAPHQPSASAPGRRGEVTGRDG